MHAHPATPATIVALASAAGRAGVAVIRVSGPQAGPALEALSRRPCPPPRRAVVRHLWETAPTQITPTQTAPTQTALPSPPDSRTDLLDQALVLWLPAPGSFTGEDVAEFQVHGGRAVVRGVLEALLRLPGLRPAEAGEFARRAFQHGRLDLTAVEGLADLVAAETAAQRRQALRQMEGAFGRLCDGWREQLVPALAWLEACIDFADDDLPAETEAAVWEQVAAVESAIAAHLADAHRGERLREGLGVAIVGAPNTGKSSLLNALARREVAIVAEQAGTTRDVVEVALDLAGLPVILADTAGLRDSPDPVEQEGVRRARHRAGQADLRLALFDAALWPALDPATLALVDACTLPLLSRCDRVDPAALPDPAGLRVAGQPALLLSARTGAGMSLLLERLTALASRQISGDDSPTLTRARHRDALSACQAALTAARQAPLLELAAEDLRLAVRALGRITGRVDVDDLLDVIFRDFCIGK